MQTHPNAFRIEASDKRAAATLLMAEADVLEAQAEELDPTPKPKTKAAEGKSRSAKSGEFVSGDEAKANPDTTVTEKPAKKKRLFGRKK
jgi:hypothetical protein